MNCPQCSYPAAAGQTTCQQCGRALTSAAPTGYTVPVGFGVPAGFGNTAEPVSAVGTLSSVTAGVFGVVALVNLVDAALRFSDSPASSAVSLVTSAAMLAIIPLFLVWFFKVRRNAGLWGPQRRGQVWSLSAWFVPVIFLWFPFQIAVDAWRTSMPSDSISRRGTAVVNAWWACWVLAWFTGLHTITTYGTGQYSRTVRTSSLSLNLGGTAVSNLFAAAAAVLAAVMVVQLGRAQEARRNPLLALR